MCLSADEFGRDLSDGALHVQQWRIVGFVVDPPARCEQILKATLPDELLTSEPSKPFKGAVDLENDAIWARGEIPARGVLEELFSAAIHRRTAAGATTP